MIQFERIIIIGIIILMSIIVNEAKTFIIYCLHNMESRKFQRKFENGIYTPERKFDFNRPEHKMDKLIFEIIEWKTMTVISGATSSGDINVFNNFMKHNRPKDGAYFISATGFGNDDFRRYIIQLIRAQFDLNRSIEIIDNKLDERKFAEMYPPPFCHSHDIDIQRALRDLILVSRSIPPQLDTQHKEFRIYDPMGDPILETLPLRIWGNEYHALKKYFYTDSFPSMATAIFIVDGKTFIEILGNKPKRDSFFKCARQFFDGLNTHAFLFGAFNIVIKEIKYIPEMIVAHYNGTGILQDEVFVFGVDMLNTIFQYRDMEPFKQVGSILFLDFRNEINRSKPPKSINLHATTKLFPPYFKHFDIRTVNGIYIHIFESDEHFNRMKYADLMKGQDTLLFFIIDDILYDRIGASIQYQLEFVDVIEKMENDQNADVVVMVCNNFEKYDIHLVTEFIFSHELFPESFVATMGYGVFNIVHEHENTQLVHYDVDNYEPMKVFLRRFS